MSRRVEFFYDVISPTAYLAWAQLPAIVARTGAELVHRPFFLGGVMQATGNRPPATVPAKGAWMQKDLDRFAQRLGKPLNRNPHFPMMNTRPAMRAAITLSQRPDYSRYLDAVFAATWRDGLDLGDKETMSRLVTDAGFDAAEFWSVAESEANKEALKANTDEAVARGAFGAPTFFVQTPAGEEMHFGQDRLDFIEEALRG